MITPGKWEVSNATRDKTSIVVDRVLVAEAHHGTSHSWAHGIDILEAQANARLIAASKDLLEACKFAFEPEAPFSKNELVYTKRVLQAIRDKAKAAIEKAGG